MIKYIFKIFFVSLFLIGSSFSEIIKKIEIIGNKRISRETIIVLGKINLNVDYSDNELNILTKRLYETEFFKDISVLCNSFRYGATALHLSTVVRVFDFLCFA